MAKTPAPKKRKSRARKGRGSRGDIDLFQRSQPAASLLHIHATTNPTLPINHISTSLRPHPGTKTKLTDSLNVTLSLRIMHEIVLPASNVNRKKIPQTNQKQPIQAPIRLFGSKTKPDQSPSRSPDRPQEYAPSPPKTTPIPINQQISNSPQTKPDSPNLPKTTPHLPDYVVF